MLVNIGGTAIALNAITSISPVKCTQTLEGPVWSFSIGLGYTWYNHEEKSEDLAHQSRNQVIEIYQNAFQPRIVVGGNPKIENCF